MADVFVSHASADATVASEVHRWITADGHRVFLDQSPDDGIRVGEDWKQRIYTELRCADAVVFLVSSSFLASSWCSAEVGIADALGCLVLPLHVAPDVRHPILGSRQRVSYHRDPAAARTRVLRQLHDLDSNGHGSWTVGDNPYPGLAAFDEGRSSVFFGRGAETLALADQIRASGSGGPSLTALAGPSGCGKSSLVQAGLVPRLAADRSWLVLPPLHPGDDPTEALASRLATAGRARRLPWTAQTLLARLRDDGDGLRGAALDLLSATGTAAESRLLVAVDQGEELFDRPTTSQVEAFLRLLRAAVDTGSVHVLIALRSAFLDDLITLAARTGVRHGTYTLAPMGRAMLAKAIEEPARLAGLRIEAELSATLVDDTSHGDALPLLAFTLNRLAEHRRRGDLLTLADYRALARAEGGGHDVYDSAGDGADGGLVAALTAHADRVLRAAGAASDLSAPEILRTLTRFATIDETGRWSRRRVASADLDEAQRRALGVFVTRRLFTADRGETGSERLTPVHEALLTAWPPLTRALEDRSAALIAARSIERAAADWDEAGRAVGYLWSGDRLAAAVNALQEAGEQQPDDLTARAFLDATRRQRQAEQRRARFTRGAVLLSAILVIAVTVSVSQWQRARAARRDAEAARRIAAATGLITQAAAARATDPQTAMELGTAAYRLYPSPQTAAGLIDTLSATRFAGSLRQGGILDAVVFTDGGRTLVTVGRDDSGEASTSAVRTWNTADRAHPTAGRPAALGLPLFTALTAPPRGAIFATVGGDDTSHGMVLLWAADPHGGPPKMIHREVVGASRLMSAAFSPDGRLLAVGAENGSVEVLDVGGSSAAPSLTVRATVVGHSGAVGAVAFDASGRVLASGGGTVATGEVLLWNLASGPQPQQLTRLAPYPTQVTSLSFSGAPGRSLLATAAATKLQGPDGTVVLWDVTDPRAPTSLDRPVSAVKQSSPVTFAPTGTLATGNDADTSVALWNIDAVTGQQEIGDPLRDGDAGTGTYTFSPDGRTLATGNSDGTVSLWDMSETTAPARAGGLPASRPHAMALAADDTLVVGDDVGAAVWTLGAPGAEASRARLPGLVGPVGAVAVAADGRTIVTGADDGSVLLWRRTSAGWVRAGALPNVGDRVRQVALDRRGRRLAVTTMDAVSGTGRTSVWSTGDPRLPRRLGVQLTGITAASLSPDGSTLAAVHTGQRVSLFSVTGTGLTEVGHVLGDADGGAVAISPDGRTLAVGNLENAVTLYDLSDRTQPTRLGSPLRDAAWTGKYYRPILTNIVTTLSYSADGRTLVSGSDNDVVVWDVTDRTHGFRAGLFRAQDVDDVGQPAAISADGSRLVTGAQYATSYGAAVLLFTLEGRRTLQADPGAAACARGGGTITEQTWRIYAGQLAFHHPCP